MKIASVPRDPKALLLTVDEQKLFKGCTRMGSVTNVLRRVEICRYYGKIVLGTTKKERMENKTEEQTNVNIPRFCKIS